MNAASQVHGRQGPYYPCSQQIDEISKFYIKFQFGTECGTIFS